MVQSVDVSRRVVQAGRTLVAALAVLLMSGTMAVNPARAAGETAGDPAAGKVRAGACFACHGRDGIGVGPSFPNLAGQKPGYLIKQMKAFKSGERKNAFMQAIARQLSDDDIRNLAAFWSGLPAGGPAQAESGADPAAG